MKIIDSRSGGVYCSICKCCITPPRKRKTWQAEWFTPCENCDILSQNAALCNTDPNYHDPTIAKILMEHKCFDSRLLEDLVKYLVEFKLSKNET
jgi:hypothetical protein